MLPKAPLSGIPGFGSPGRTVAEEAAAVLLELPQAQRNGALPSLATYLAFEAPTVDPLPFMFFRSGYDNLQDDPDLLVRARRLAVGGRLLVARVRWLDEMIDSRKPLGTLADAHRLSAAVYKKALSYFIHCLSEGQEAEFFMLLASLEACYATSLAVDTAYGGMSRGEYVTAPVKLCSYAEQARARAMVASAPVEAQMIITGANEEEKQRARKCLGSLAVAWQLGDDVLDLEEDYRDGRLSWIVSETLHGLLGVGDLPPEPDDFYEAALIGGHVRRALEESLAYYREAERAARELYPGILTFVRREIDKTAEILADLTAIVSPSAQR